jgi:hypothetical protein
MDVLLLQLEILSNGGSLHEVAHIANGSHPRNCISLLRINVSILLISASDCWSLLLIVLTFVSINKSASDIN